MATHRAILLSCVTSSFGDPPNAQTRFSASRYHRPAGKLRRLSSRRWRLWRTWRPGKWLLSAGAGEKGQLLTAKGSEASVHASSGWRVAPNQAPNQANAANPALAPPVGCDAGRGVMENCPPAGSAKQWQMPLVSITTPRAHI